jgi:hypothetical protein
LLRDHLAALPPADHGPFVLDLITPHIEAVPGYTTSAQIEPGREFHDLGFDSLTAIELQNLDQEHEES